MYLQMPIRRQNLSKSEIAQLKTFLHQNENIFSTSLADIEKTNLFKHLIDTLIHTPIHHDVIGSLSTERQVKNMLVTDHYFSSGRRALPPYATTNSLPLLYLDLKYTL